MHEFDVVLLEDETGGYVALFPALPGCHTLGDTLAEVMDNIKEAIDLYMETPTEREKKDLIKEKVVDIQKVAALSKILPISADKLIKVLEKKGFRVVRQKGSHVMLFNPQSFAIFCSIHPWL